MVTEKSIRLHLKRISYVLFSFIIQVLIQKKHLQTRKHK